MRLFLVCATLFAVAFALPIVSEGLSDVSLMLSIAEHFVPSLMRGIWLHAIRMQPLL